MFNGEIMNRQYQMPYVVMIPPMFVGIKFIQHLKAMEFKRLQDVIDYLKSKSIPINKVEIHGLIDFVDLCNRGEISIDDFYLSYVYVGE